MQPLPILYIVMPCYNEEAGLVDTVNTVLQKLQQLQSNGKVSAESATLFSDDGSKDSTWRIIESAHTQYPDKVKAVKLAANRGKEYALWAGVMKARLHADAVVCLDADLQFDIDAIDEFIVGLAPRPTVPGRLAHAMGTRVKKADNRFPLMPRNRMPAEHKTAFSVRRRVAALSMTKRTSVNIASIGPTTLSHTHLSPEAFAGTYNIFLISQYAISH